jgi:RNA recognition motif-containing protein
MLKISNANCSP